MGLCGDDSLDGQTAQTMQNLISQHALTNRVRAGLVWNAASVFLKLSLGLIRSIIIARLLAPDDYGLFGMAAALVGALSAYNFYSRLAGGIIQSYAFVSLLQSIEGA